MASIKKNFAYSSILTVSTYIFPLITYPYVSRVLGVYNVGVCNFVDSIINYFILFSMMGMQIMAIREIANTHGDKGKQSTVFSSLFLLNLITTVVALVTLFILIQVIPKLHEYKYMMYIGMAKILFNSLLIEWYYKGIENFQYITFRSLIVKCLYVILVFTLVKSSEDYYVYYFITVLVVIINALINILYSRHLVDFSFRKIDFKPYIHSFFILGFYLFLTSMYTSFNTAYLGFISGEIEVGYYSTAVKLYSVILGIFSAFTGVMLPRMSSLLAEGNRSEFMRLTNKSLDVLLCFSLPLIMYSIVFAPQLVRLISGPGYEGAIIPMRIVMPLMLIIGYEQVLIVQILTPLEKDKALFINSSIGAVVGLVLNLMIVHRLGAIGSSIVWVFSEVSVLCSAQYFVSKYLSYDLPLKRTTICVLTYLPAALLFLIISRTFSGVLAPLLVGFIILLIYTFLVECFILKNTVVRDSFYSILSVIKKKK